MHTFLRPTDLRLESRQPRTGRHLAARAPDCYHRVPAIHPHVMAAPLFGWNCCQARYKTGHDRRRRPKQDGTHYDGRTSSTHNHQSRLLAGHLQSVRLCRTNLSYDTDLIDPPAVMLVTTRSRLSHPRGKRLPLSPRNRCPLIRWKGSWSRHELPPPVLSAIRRLARNGLLGTVWP